MAKDLPKYKYIKVTLNDSNKFVFLYSDYESPEKLETSLQLIDKINNYSIYGVKSETGKDINKYKEELFEYDIKASGVFERLRLYETKTYNCTWNFDNLVSVQNEKELDYKKTNEKQFSFRVVNYLGKSSFTIDGQKTIPFEIIPTKIDYEDDYVQLTKDIADQCSQLLLDYTSPTNLSFKLDPEKTQKTPLEQFIFIRKFCSAKNIEYLMQSIKMNPDRMLVSEDELKPFGVAPISHKFFSNPFSNSKNWNKQSDGSYLPELIATTRKYDSYNTPANQFIKFAFKNFIQICQNVITYVGDYSYKDEAIYLKQSLEVFLMDPFFDDVKELSSMPVNNQVLQKREGYSQIFYAFNMLDLAMQLNWEGQKDVYEGEARNIALLYEYWLVFKFIEIFRKLGAIIDFNLDDEKTAKKFLSKENGLLISLSQGKPSYIPMELEDKKVKINFYYNRTFSKKDFSDTYYEGSYSRDFRPDYTLAIFPSDIANERTAIKEGLVSFIHFDAKYRVTDITSLFGKDVKEIIEEKKEHNPSDLTEDEKKFLDDSLSGKEKEEFEEKITGDYLSSEKREETINTYNRGDLLKMHTYNDAIRRTVGSYVLYPGKENNEKDRFKVYDELLPGVGAFAIRPGDKTRKGEEAVKQFIFDIIDFKIKESSRQFRKEYFENMVINSPSENNPSKIEQPDEEYLMIGFIREEYLDFLKSHHIIPTSYQEFDQKNDWKFYFYFYAIKGGKVYTIHKETNKTQYLMLTDTDINDCKIEAGYKFQHLLPFEAKIESLELVTKDSLQEKINEFYEEPFIPKNDFNADYYYLAEARIINYARDEERVTDVSVKENEDISAYSPKITYRKYINGFFEHEKN